jgi:hypothetical protein
MLLAALTAAEKRRWSNFWTGDGSWIKMVNPPTGPWMMIDAELSQRVRQTIGARKSMLTVVFNPKAFAIVALLPQDTSCTAISFVKNVILPLVNCHAQWLRISTVTSCICISTILSTMLLGMSKKRWPSGRPCSPLPNSPDLAIADFYLFGQLKQQLSRRTLNPEENVLETMTKILSELPKDEVKSAFLHWKKMPMGRRPQWRVRSELAERQATLISFHLIRDPDIVKTS